MIQNTKFRSLKQTAQSALLQLFKKVSRLIQIHLNQNRKEVVIACVVGSYLVDVVFTLFEFDAEVRQKIHPFYDGLTYSDGTHWNGWVTMANFVYGFMVMLSRAMLLFAAYISIKYHVQFNLFGVCALVEVSDMIDYWLTRNGPWFTLDHFLIFHDWEFEYNYIKIGIVLTYCYIEWKRLRYTGCSE